MALKPPSIKEMKKALAENFGVVASAARELRIPVTTLHSRIAKSKKLQQAIIDGELDFKDKAIQALTDSNGFRVKAAQQLGLTSNQFSRMAARYEELVELERNFLESRIDTAEEKLLQSINKGDSRSIEFFLKNRGKHRGYGDVEADSLELSPEIVNEELLDIFSRIAENLEKSSSKDIKSI